MTKTKRNQDAEGKRERRKWNVSVDIGSDRCGERIAGVEERRGRGRGGVRRGRGFRRKKNNNKRTAAIRTDCDDRSVNLSEPNRSFSDRFFFQLLVTFPRRRLDLLVPSRSGRDQRHYLVLPSFASLSGFCVSLFGFPQKISRIDSIENHWIGRFEFDGPNNEMTRPTPFFLNMKSTFSNEVFLLIWFANGTETPLPSFRLAPRSANQIGPSNQDFYGRITGAVLMADRTKEEKRQKKTHTHTQRTAKNRWISTKTKTKSNKKKTNNQRKQPPFHLFFVA